MASDGRSLRRRRAHQKVVRLLYGKCCGQRGGCGRLRICCCWSSNRRGSETPQPRLQTASPGFTVGALFCRRLFGLFAQDYTGRWIHVVDLAARETGHRHINVVVLRDVLGNKAPGWNDYRLPLRSENGGIGLKAESGSHALTPRRVVANFRRLERATTAPRTESWGHSTLQR